jgi:hypothetical protein
VARLFADENFPFPVVQALRHLGHDVVTLAEVGKAGQAITDKAILELAAADQRAVVTLNRKHFVPLHEADPSHAGIIVCSLDLDFEGQAARGGYCGTRVNDRAPYTGKSTAALSPDR